MRISRATLVLILAIVGPTAAAGIAHYRIGQLEVERVDMETRLRAVERAVVRFEATTEAVEKQTDAIIELRQSVTKLIAEQRAANENDTNRR
jgi:hypothetical protein